MSIEFQTVSKTFCRNDDERLYNVGLRHGLEFRIGLTIKMTSHVFRFSFLAAMLISVVLTARAQITVTVDRNLGGDANPEFKFKLVRSPLKDDAAARARLTLLAGEADPAGADLSALTDGILPTGENQPKSNFSFDSGSSGGRFSMDLGRVIEIRQINSYSWHSGNRAPQVYRLYASNGADPQFCAEPRGDVDPASCGWTLITSVDTRRGRGGGGEGQYGASINDARGSLGKYRYLLFECSATETDDDAGNTFFSEIDVVAKKSP